jgi:adenine-specific DNA-methyltransferase
MGASSGYAQAIAQKSVPLTYVHDIHDTHMSVVMRNRAAWAACMRTVSEAAKDAAMASTHAEHQRLHGQYLTPMTIADAMAGMIDFTTVPSSPICMDPGAGSGMLGQALIRAMVISRPDIQRMSMRAYESDTQITPMLRDAADAYVRNLQDIGITADYTIDDHRFPECALTHEACTTPWSDIAIINPPYKKCRASDAMTKHMASLGFPVTNAYAAFVMATILMTKPGGQVVAIIPRSGFHGPYFASFRAMLASAGSIERIHAFTTRDVVFGDDDVLQEMVILHYRAGVPQRSHICISHSADDRLPWVERMVPASSVWVDHGDVRFIHIPMDAWDDDVSYRMHRQPCRLSDLGCDVSTGKVVEFRARNACHMDHATQRIPLIQPCHIARGIVRHQSSIRKESWFSPDAPYDKLAHPSGHYVLIKRCSSRDEPHRITAAAWHSQTAFACVNHINVIHRNGHGLPEPLVRGLAWYLNTDLVDRYVRIYNGQIVINAADLRILRVPDLAMLTCIGLQARMPSVSDPLS